RSPTATARSSPASSCGSGSRGRWRRSSATGRGAPRGRRGVAAGRGCPCEVVRLRVEVAEVAIVGDRPGDLEGALRFAAEAGVALIVTSGGLGPTADALTGEVVAAFAGAPLELDEDMRAHIAGILAGWAKRNGFAGPAL